MGYWQTRQMLEFKKNGLRCWTSSFSVLFTLRFNGWVKRIIFWWHWPCFWELKDVDALWHHNEMHVKVLTQYIIYSISLIYFLIIIHFVTWGVFKGSWSKFLCQLKINTFYVNFIVYYWCFGDLCWNPFAQILKLTPISLVLAKWAG